jgi:phage repressor protein C with HTH and peptisase S24 domain
MTDMKLAEHVSKFREAKKWGQKELAAAAGVSQQSIADIESGRVKRPRSLFEIAKALEVTPEQLDPERFAKRTVEVDLPQVYGERDLPVYASAEGGNGAMIVNFDPVNYTLRGAPLLGVKGAYAIYVSGDSMVPAYDPGDTALVNPNLPAAPGHDYVFFQSDGHGQTIACIKRLMRIASDKWHVRQFNPQMDFTLDRKLWSEAQRVVGRYND